MNIKNYEEFNEGLSNKLAALALGSALSLGTPSCVPDGEVRIEQEYSSMQRKHGDEFKIYEFETSHEQYNITYSQSKKVISTSWRHSTGKSLVNHHTIYIDKDVKFIYYRIGGWDGHVYATDNPKYANISSFTILDISNLKIVEENEYYIVLNTSIWNNAINKIYVSKGKNPNNLELTTTLDGMNLGLIEADGYDCWIKID